MKERPILFSGPMVRAILDGRKSQTRRLIKFTKEQEPPTGDLYLQRMYGHTTEGRPFGDFAHWRIVGPDYPDGDADDVRCPYGGSGDRLWVRETFGECNAADQDGQLLVYRADYDDITAKECYGGLWHPSIHMPRTASRITLEVTGVRVERLQEITPRDAEAEGISKPDHGDHLSHRWCAVESYRALWEEINGPGSWDANPWVWIIEFKRIK